MKKIFVVLVLVSVLTATAFAGSMSDVPSNHWAYEAVNELVAAGLIQGYPDGTFQGQNELTRYEVSVMLARLIENIEAERELMLEEVDFNTRKAIHESEKGLSEGQGEQVEVIVETLLEKNLAEFEVEPEVTQDDVDEALALIEDLLVEFEADLNAQGVVADILVDEIRSLTDRVADLEDADLDTRVADLESTPVSFSGEWKVDFTNYASDNDAWEDPFNINSDDKADDNFVNKAADNTFKQVLDLDINVDTDVLNADFGLKAVHKGYGFGDAEYFDMDSLEGVIEGNDFKATIKEEQAEGFKPYLFDKPFDDDDGLEVNGAYVESAVGDFILHSHVVEDAVDVDGEVVDWPFYAFGGTNTVDSLGGFNVHYGIANLYGFPSTTEISEDEILLQRVVGVDKTFDLAEFEVTPDFAISNFDFDQRYFDLNVNGELGTVDATFNLVDITPDFTPIATGFEWKKGFDLSGEMQVIDRVDLGAKYEDYIDTDYGVDYDEDSSDPHFEFTAEVSEDNAYDLAGFATTADFLFASYTSDDEDATNKEFNAQAKRTFDALDVTGKLEWQNMTEFYATRDDDDSETDKFDKILELDYTLSDKITAGANYKLDNETDLVDHKYNVDYAKDAVKAGAEIDVAGEEQKLYANYNLDKEESFDIMALAVKPYADFTTWLKEEATNINLGVEAVKEVTANATLSAGYDWSSIEKDVTDDDHEILDTGLLNKKWVKGTYAISEDVEAFGEFVNWDLDADDEANDFKSDKVTAGVSVAF